MAAKISLDDQTLQQLQSEGELRVEDAQGVPLVLMTVDARDQLSKAMYDDSEFTEAELKAQGAELLQDSEGWGAADMDVYDTMDGIKPSDHAS